MVGGSGSFRSCICLDINDCPHRDVMYTYVRYTIDSRPLFLGTVNDAFESSTVYMLLFQSGKYVSSQDVSSCFILATTSSTLLDGVGVILSANWIILSGWVK